jgi:hypothetical protein
MMRPTGRVNVLRMRHPGVRRDPVREKETMMRKLILAATIGVSLAGCATGGYYGQSDGGNYRPNPYRSETGNPNDWSRPYYGDRYWPPVDLNSPFPPQIMDGGSKGK